MQTLIQEILNNGDAVTIYLSNQTEPIRAAYVKSTDSAMLLRTASGHTIVRADSIYRIEVPAAAAPSTELNITPVTVEQPAAAIYEEKEAETPVVAEKEEIYEPADEESFTPIFTPKVVGRIDLSAINDPRRKRQQENVPSHSTDNPLMPAGGTITSIGPAFGFITATDGESLFFSRAEVMQRNNNDMLYKGMPVVFTPGHNAKGGVARCVHAQLTMQEQLEWIEKIEKYDLRNARMMAEQLMLAFPDDAELADTLSTFSSRPYQPANSYARIGVPIADKVLAAVEQGHYIEPAELLKAEKEIAATKPYDEAFAQISQLLEHAKTNHRQQCYQIYVRLIKLARNQGDSERAFATIDNAISFYADEAGARTYFEGLRRKAEADNFGEPAPAAEAESHAPAASSTDVSQPVCDRLMSSTKANATIISASEELLKDNIDAIYERLNESNECVCGRVDLAEIEADGAFERRVYYAVLRSLSDAVAAKFDTELPMPAEERFLGENVSEFSAMAELTAAVKGMRAMLTDRAETARHRFHVVILASHFSRIIDLTANGNLSENFMRHFKAVAETPDVNLQLVAAGSPELTEFTQQRQTSFKTFSTYTVG